MEPVTCCVGLWCALKGLAPFVAAATAVGRCLSDDERRSSDDDEKACCRRCGYSVAKAVFSMSTGLCADCS
jgi:hypothetical protein